MNIWLSFPKKQICINFWGRQQEKERQIQKKQEKEKQEKENQVKKTQEKENPGKYYQEKEDQKKARQETERKSEKVRAALMPIQAIKGPPQIQVQARFEEVDKADTGPRSDKVHNCLLCEAKEGKNLNFSSGLVELRKHYSVCLYKSGQFKSVGNPGEANRDQEGKVVDENGMKFRYRCEVPECSRRGVKPLSFKEWAIHAGVFHHLVE